MEIVGGFEAGLHFNVLRATQVLVGGRYLRSVHMGHPSPPNSGPADQRVLQLFVIAEQMGRPAIDWSTSSKRPSGSQPMSRRWIVEGIAIMMAEFSVGDWSKSPLEAISPSVTLQVAFFHTLRTAQVAPEARLR
ncbi:MAG: hypothetical protein EXR58_08870 [Chloroflexi bacterium]|nr:hypothetical protein [Chloroflexota bacterium]